MGVLPQEQRTGSGRRCSVHCPSHHSSRDFFIRRLRQIGHQSSGQSPHARIGIGAHQMTIGATNTTQVSAANRRLRLGMVGGGPGAFIGAVHRIAARLDDHYELVAAALSSTAEKSLRSGAAIGLERTYPDYETMAREEAARPDGIEAVAIVTPNDQHAPAAEA